ncbi:uncharacterized protein LTR77_002548 [Saxophila tyrrhenica]|uniref:Zn(2)-C6 fungal-type domain-containing protein n=1 Tax=Saxophila tyrrhenica TaxID=1690608 RepID=A0AAV9PJ86_9PEZI|nr:hypothetical protein LTR77_002548 [Saxophila tyrrhenica]
MSAAPPGVGFDASSQSGSDFGFGTPQSMSIDTMMQGSDMPTSRPPPVNAPGGIGAFGAAYDPSLVGPPGTQNGHHQHRGSMSSFQDGTSPVLGHQHRLSINSNGPFPAQDRHYSFGGSDTTSPGGQRGHGSIGDNSRANNSNDTVDSQNADKDENNKNGDNSNNPPPAWSELKTKAGKERKRLPLACIACRRKKIRCSGEKPACKHCLRSRIPCVYKVTTRKAAPRTDYMAMLDKRLKRMEERVIKIVPKEEQGIVSSTGRAVVKPPLPPPPPRSAGGSKKRAAEAAFGDELDEWANAKAPVVEAKDGIVEEGEKEPLKKQASEEHNLLQEGADKLPPKAIQEHLAEVFFDAVYCQSYPLLHKPSFMRKLAHGTVPPVLTLAVCAISARFSNHPEVRTEPAFLRGEVWASAARDIALRRYDTPNITILIVYLILGLHEFGTCQGGRSWMFGGMAQRMAYALQLHKDLDHDPRSQESDEKNELTFTDREIRRRTMWSCFLMDRFNSSGTDRPLFVGEQYIRAQLPIKDSYFQMDITGPTEDLDGNVPNPVEPGSGQMSNAQENMGVTAYLIRLVSIWGKLVAYLNLGGKDRDGHPMWAEESTFHDIKRAVKAWKEALPDGMQYNAENLQNHASEKAANQFIFLHIVYNQVLLFMNRFALPIPGSRPTFPKDMPESFISEASRAAHEAANQISNLVNEGMDHHVVAPFAGYSAFFSSTVHIYGAFSKNPSLEASSKQNLAWNVKYLTKLKKYWGMFHFVTENLRDLYRRHADAARSGSKSKEGDQAIFQYGDWFDRYPHGVSGTDYEEPSAEIKKEPGADAVLGQKSDLQSVEEFFSKLSPPSRAAVNQEKQPQHRKMAKRRHSKTQSKQSNTANTQHSQQQPQQQSEDLPQDRRPSVDELMSQQAYHQQPDLSALSQQQQQHSTAFPPGFQPPHNPLLLTPPQQQMMSQLDRQMVLNSYAGINPPSSATHPGFNTLAANNNPNPMLDPSLDPFDFHSMSNGNGNGSGNMWGDPSSAWFMPFNMDPPAIGEDSGWFNGGFDWSGFGGGLDFGVQGTGLTPRPELDVETVGQEGLGGSSGVGEEQAAGGGSGGGMGEM